MKLSILICSLTDRQQFLDRLLDDMIDPQLMLQPDLSDDNRYWAVFETDEHFCYEVEILIELDNKEKSIGDKRNKLLAKAKGEYVAFIDDDDRISDNYLKLLFEGIEKGVDCCSLKGIITEDGNDPRSFEHSIKYNAYKTNELPCIVTYERYPNHLNCIKSSIAKQFKFPDWNVSEDTDWATQIHKSGLIKTEHYIEDVIYFYDYRNNK